MKNKKRILKEYFLELNKIDKDIEKIEIKNEYIIIKKNGIEENLENFEILFNSELQNQKMDKKNIIIQKMINEFLTVKKENSEIMDIVITNKIETFRKIIPDKEKNRNMDILFYKVTKPKPKKNINKKKKFFNLFF